MLNPHSRPTRPRLREESGIALIAAIAVLLIVSLLAAGAVTVAVETSSSTTHDEQRKAALAAAEAGLRVATYRLTMLNPTQADCISNNAAVAPTGEYCKASSESLGNGTSFAYTTTPVLSSAAKQSCVGLTVTVKSEAEGVSQRCVTATGSANGIKQRLEARVATFTAIPLFPVPGVIGKKEVKLKGSASVEGAIASNGKITAESKAEQTGSSELAKCELGPSGKFEHAVSNTSVCKEGVKERTQEEGEIVVSSVQPGDATLFSTGPNCPTGPEKEPTGNCDFRIENGAYDDELNYKGTLREPYDLVTGTVEFTGQTAKDPVLKMHGKSSITLGGGVYYFCSLETINGDATITVAANTKTEIFIGSPECPSGTGTLNFSGNFNNASNEPTALQIFIYGEGSATLTGSAATSATLYGPEATIKVTGNFEFEGGIAGGTVTLEGNAHFKWSQADKFLEKGSAKPVTAYYRTAWTQCTPEGEPGEGC